jgi:hypothetical protein
VHVLFLRFRLRDDRIEPAIAWSAESSDQDSTMQLYRTVRDLDRHRRVIIADPDEDARVLYGEWFR